VKLGGRWRSRNPLRYFLISEAISFAVLVLSFVIFAVATAGGGLVRQPEGAIGGSGLGIGLALIVLFLVLGAIDLTRHIHGMLGRSRTPRPAPPRPGQARNGRRDRPGEALAALRTGGRRSASISQKTAELIS
jgi:uncharacterized membrane protein YdfJ with MMPL/SSD domain